jgi:hypothetical protein
MPFISREESKEIREKLKAAFPKYKFSVKIDHHTSLQVSLLQSDIPVTFRPGSNYRGVSHYWLQSDLADNPMGLAFWEAVIDIINSVKEHKTQYEDADYGSVPTFYLDLSFGSWQKPYKYIKD